MTLISFGASSLFSLPFYLVTHVYLQLIILSNHQVQDSYPLKNSLCLQVVFDFPQSLAFLLFLP